jgi:glycosyltransferase involved in cell wall biosynthesis
MKIKESVPVTVIIPFYKSEATLNRAIASILSQTQLPQEIILVDDASGDEASVFLHDLVERNQPIIRLIQLHTNAGAGGARNIGWAASTQPYVAFLDADDAWHPRKLEVQYKVMAENPAIALTGHGHRILDTNVNPDWLVGDVALENISKWQMLLSNRFVTPSVMLRRDLAARFIDGQRYMEDHMLWLSIVCTGGITMRLSADLAALYKPAFGSAGLSAQMWLMERGDLGNYVRVYKNDWINCLSFSFLMIYSCFKFFRRLLMYWGYLRWKA